MIPSSLKSQLLPTSSSLQFPNPTATRSLGSRVETMEGEVGLGFLSPARSSCVSSEGVGVGSPMWASPLEKLLNWPSSCVSNGRGFSSPTWESPLEKLLNSPSSCVSDGRGNGGGFTSPTWESQLETLLYSPPSCVSDGRGGGNSGCSSPLGLSVEQGSEVREAERLLRATAERYDDCFLRLRDATVELADLRRERLRLSAENLHLSLLLEELEAEQRKQASTVAPTLPPKPVKGEAPRGGAPKSISIRSMGYLSQKQPQGEAEPQRLRVRAPPAMEEAGEKEKGGGEVEVDVYRQGAEKTELCNKWERGACSYGRRCRFAHGLQELRPVIRHPRYKTLPCQMFAAASGCPYGHRCHFRHSPPPAAESY